MTSRSSVRPKVVRPRALAVVLAVALACTALGGAVAGASHDHVVLSVGHVDAIDLQVVDDELTILVHDDTVSPAVDRDPDDVLFHVKEEAALEVPPGFEWLGPAGSTVWLLPMTQDHNLLWPGWATERLPAGYLDAAPTLRLTEVEGPGDVEVWVWDAAAQAVRYFSSDEALPSGNAVTMGSHVHVNWGFTERGAYTLTFEVDAVRQGQPITLGPVEYRWHVGDLPQAPETELSIAGMAASYEAGDLVTLEAVQDPPTSLEHYHWFVKGAGATEWSVVPGETGATYSFIAASGLDGAQYVVRLYDDHHDEVAASDPVTLHVTDPGPVGEYQTITVELDPSQGALVLSVDPGDREVLMSPLELASSADRWTSSGDLRPVTVTDTRSGAPGWTASGQVGDFASSTASFEGGFLGWSPLVVPGAAEGVVAGPVVAPGFPSGDGLALASTLASAAAGSGFGTSVLGAGLALEVPTTVPAGTYTATLTFTVI